MKKAECPKVIVFGDGFGNTLGLIRSVGECGIPVTLILEPGGKVDNPVRFSRYVERIHDLTTLDDVVDVLKKNYGACERRPVVLCGNDHLMSVLDRRYDELKDRFCVFNAQAAGRINRLMDKANMASLVTGEGISLIRTWHPKGGEPVPADIAYPCLVKGNNSTTSTKSDLVVCRDEAALLGKLRDGGDYLVQEYIEKEYELDIVGLSWNGGKDAFVPAVVRKIRDGFYRQSDYIRLDDVRDYPDLDIDAVKRIVREAGYEGIFSVELLYSKGRYYFLEINLRNDGVCYLYTAAGINYPKLWIDYCRSALSAGDLSALRFRHPFFQMSLWDLLNLFGGKVPFGQWVREFVSADIRFDMNVKDPLPFLVEMAIHFRQACKKLVRKVFRVKGGSPCGR